eukprot:TRINITY_DN9268_c0_g1_i1.p1 TRINITY_DN9268_c0_g1~~TRINITY_DN9268_c0_g1_i1.p1  ORF type:complete len:494 (-),score=52.41 TRINITY_DN9268_c0_g1_i1:1082-2563(-)
MDDLWVLLETIQHHALPQLDIKGYRVACSTCKLWRDLVNTKPFWEAKVGSLDVSYMPSLDNRCLDAVTTECLQLWNPPSLEAWEVEALKIRFKFLTCSIMVTVNSSTIMKLDTSLRQKRWFYGSQWDEAIDYACPGDFVVCHEPAVDNSTKDLVITKPIVLCLRNSLWNSLQCSLQGGLQDWPSTCPGGENRVQPIILMNADASEIVVKDARVALLSGMTEALKPGPGAEVVIDCFVRTLTINKNDCAQLSYRQDAIVVERFDTVSDFDGTGSTMDGMENSTKKQGERKICKNIDDFSSLEGTIEYLYDVIRSTGDMELEWDANVLDKITDQFPYNLLIMRRAVDILWYTLEKGLYTSVLGKPAVHKFILKMMNIYQDYENDVFRLIVIYGTYIMEGVFSGEWEWGRDFDTIATLYSRWYGSSSLSSPLLTAVSIIAMFASECKLTEGTADKILTHMISHHKSCEVISDHQDFFFWLRDTFKILFGIGPESFS